MSSGRPLARKKEKAIAALLATGTIGQAAQQAGVCEKTLRNWLAQADFAAAFRAARRQVVEQALGILQQASIQAVAALVRNLNCGRHAVEVSAANHLLERSMAAVEEFDLLSRIEALEERLGQQSGATYANRDPHANGEASRGPGR
jgi:hypothetical protein